MKSALPLCVNFLELRKESRAIWQAGKNSPDFGEAEKTLELKTLGT
jgi:hypothetical protein